MFFYFKKLVVLMFPSGLLFLLFAFDLAFGNISQIKTTSLESSTTEKNTSTSTYTTSTSMATTVIVRTTDRTTTSVTAAILTSRTSTSMDTAKSTIKTSITTPTVITPTTLTSTTTSATTFAAATAVQTSTTSTTAITTSVHAASAAPTTKDALPTAQSAKMNLTANMSTTGAISDMATAKPKQLKCFSGSIDVLANQSQDIVRLQVKEGTDPYYTGLSDDGFCYYSIKKYVCNLSYFDEIEHPACKEDDDNLIAHTLQFNQFLRNSKIYTLKGTRAIRLIDYEVMNPKTFYFAARCQEDFCFPLKWSKLQNRHLASKAVDDEGPAVADEEKINELLRNVKMLMQRLSVDLPKQKLIKRQTVRPRSFQQRQNTQQSMEEEEEKNWIQKYWWTIFLTIAILFIIGLAIFFVIRTKTRQKLTSSMEVETPSEQLYRINLGRLEGYRRVMGTIPNTPTK